MNDHLLYSQVNLSCIPACSYLSSFLYLIPLTVYPRACSYFFSSSQTWGWNCSLGKSLEIFNCFREVSSLTIHIIYRTATFFPIPLWFIPWIHRRLDNDFTWTQSSGCLIASHNISWDLSAKLNVNSKGSVIPNHHPALSLTSCLWEEDPVIHLLFCTIMSSGWNFSPFPTPLCLHPFHHLHKNNQVTSHSCTRFPWAAEWLFPWEL